LALLARLTAEVVPAPPRNRPLRTALKVLAVLCAVTSTEPPEPTVIGTWTQAPLLKDVRPTVRGPVPSSTVTFSARRRTYITKRLQPISAQRF
jgi:hypothetical protein